jgi:iron-sulfur cluster assembly protein
MNKEVITITENAAQYIRGILNKETDKGRPKALRISIKKGGCSGSEYDFQYASAKQPMDEEVTAHGVTVYIDPTALLNIIGSVMDFEEDIFESKLTFTNPHEKSRCGCGKSVQFDVPTKGDKNDAH